MKALNGTPLATVYCERTGIPFTVRYVRKGDGYGVNLSLIHDKDMPLVEFYDARWKFTGELGAEYGQFVSRYYRDTLLRDAGKPCGLILDGGNREAWTICATTMALVHNLVANWSR